MPPDGWRAFYQSDLQGVWLAWLAPLAFLAALPWLRERARALDPWAARFVRGWCVVFALETLLDPLATGPLARALGVAGTPAGTALVFVFVLLGDFRIFLLLFHLEARERVLARSLRRAALWTLFVPLATLAIWGPLRLARELPDQVMWLCYETLFAALALGLRRGVAARVGRDRPALAVYLRAVLLFVFAYYALWAAADVLILSGVDAGWALRVIPNQLYYAWTVPCAWLAFFGLGRDAPRA
jgi:hypothetical protein